MKDRWEKGDPVNLSDLLKITPVANEIIRLSNELNMKCSDIVWIATEIMKDCNYQELYEQSEEDELSGYESEDDIDLADEDWEPEDDDAAETFYRVQMRVYSKGRFPEVSFKAGMNEKEDVNKFLTMIAEILEKMDI